MDTIKVYIEKIEKYDFDKIYGFLGRVTEKSGVWKSLENKKTILLKPNLLGAFKPEKAVTTHPVVLEAMIKLLLEHKKTVWIGDSPGGSVLVQKVWRETGIEAIASKYNLNLVNFNSGGIITRKNGKFVFNISKYFFEADAVINVAKYKTHSLMSYTGAVKNLYGIIPGLKKSDFHRQNPEVEAFAKVISNLYEIAKEKVVFNVLDGIWGMEGEGPSAGIPRNFGVIFASEKAAVLDFIASQMMGFSLEQLQYVSESLETDEIKPEQIIIPEEWKNFKFRNVKIKRINTFLKILAYSPQFVKDAFVRLFQYYPDFNEKCTLCQICVKTCPMQVMKVEKGKKHPTIDYNQCIKCMCCHEVCPESAIFVKKSFLAKFLIK